MTRLAGGPPDPHQIQLPTLHCHRCGYDWHPKFPRLPQTCPKCRNFRWNIPRAEAPTPAGQPIDLMAALKDSLATKTPDRKDPHRR